MGCQDRVINITVRWTYLLSLLGIFLLMELHQPLVVEIGLSVYGMLRQDNKKQNLMVIVVLFYQYASLLMVHHWLLVVQIDLSAYGILIQEKNNQNQKVILQYVSLLMVLNQHMVEVRISLSAYEILRIENQKLNWIFILMGSNQFVSLLMVHLQQLEAQRSLFVYWMFRQDKKKPICFSPDGTTLTSGSNDKTIRLCLWDVKTGKSKSKFDVHTNDVNQVCFSPDGTILASCSVDKFIYLLDIQAQSEE
ncbi:unnamed protein product [Paramecium sonneborni]|uniref:Uncharacterized protein n=1 Tax=Paramecium sonneborni TaxID=65129 RepID=A0A8S1QK49_9CILI|nr:unnamed protein product [Paramecium sonneborni]